MKFNKYCLDNLFTAWYHDINSEVICTLVYCIFLSVLWYRLHSQMNRVTMIPNCPMLHLLAFHVHDTHIFLPYTNTLEINWGKIIYYMLHSWILFSMLCTINLKILQTWINVYTHIKVFLYDSNDWLRHLVYKHSSKIWVIFLSAENVDSILCNVTFAFTYYTILLSYLFFSIIYLIIMVSLSDTIQFVLICWCI